MLTPKERFIGGFCCFFIVIWMCSCNTSKIQRNKHDEKKTENVDSAGVKKTTTRTTDKKDSIVVIKKKEDTGTEVEIEFGDETDSTVTTTVIGKDSIITTGKKPIRIKYKTSKETSTTDSSGISAKATTITNTFDSSTLKKNTAVEIHDKNKVKKTSRIPWIAIVVTGILIIFFVLFLYFRRKEKLFEDLSSKYLR